jgi:hypothetical protein
MQLKLPLVFFSALLGLMGCGKTTQPRANSSNSAGEASSPAARATAEAIKPKLDTCALLTSKEIQEVQGEAIAETKLTGQPASGFSISQCFFRLPTFSNSISLLVTQKGEGAGARDPHESWRDSFPTAQEKEKEKDHDRKTDRDKKMGGEEQEKGTSSQRVSGIGDEAYWTATRLGGELYVLKGNSYVRISVGGPADQATKIKKSKALAQKVLMRL